MIKTLLIGSAMLIALPALAQTTGTTGSAAGGTSVPAATPNTNADSATMRSTATPATGMQTNGSMATTNDSNWGRGTTGANGQTGSMATTANTGIGGPYEPMHYPRCSRTVRDSCVQSGRRR